MTYYWQHTFIACIISFAAFVIAGYWMPLPFGLIPTDALIAGGLFYVAREAVTSKLADKRGWQYPLVATGALTSLGRVADAVGVLP